MIPGLLLVMMGCMEIGIERCWKQLYGGQWYSWKSLFEQPQEAQFKGNSWTFDVRCLGFLWIDPETPLFLGSYKRYIFQETTTSL